MRAEVEAGVDLEVPQPGEDVGDFSF